MGRRPDQTPRSEQAASARPSTHRHRASLAIDRSIGFQLSPATGPSAQRRGFPMFTSEGRPEGRA